MHMPSSGYCPNNTSVPYTVLWHPSVCSHNVCYCEGHMLHVPLKGSARISQHCILGKVDCLRASHPLDGWFIHLAQLVV